MNLKLKGKKAVITGATRGIGRAMAETRAAEGVDLGICARNEDAVKETVTTLKKFGGYVTGSAIDVANGPSLKAWIPEAGESLGGIDILVCNASAMATLNNESDWNISFQTDLMGTVRAVAAAKPFLERAGAQSGDASIVIISSVSASEAFFESAYGATKAALIHFAKGVARREAGKHVRANVVSPGMVYFKGSVWNTLEEQSPEVFKRSLGLNPMGRMASPSEIASAVAFLASPVSSFTSGVNLVIDGALVARVNY